MSEKKNFIGNKIRNVYISKMIKQKIAKKEMNKNYKSKTSMKKQIKYYRNLRKEDVIYKIIDNLSSRLARELKKLNIKKTLTHKEIIGCEPLFLKNYLMEKFDEDMNYENYGDWEVDHMKPISSFDFTNEKEILICFNYKNLQPLWRPDNLEKSDKIISDNIS